MESQNSPTTKPLYRGTQVVWYLLGIVEVLLASRFFLKVADANPGAGFVDFIYTLSQPLIMPFATVFGVAQVEGIIFEWITLLAIIVYAIVAWGITRLFFMSKTVSTAEAAAKLT